MAENALKQLKKNTLNMFQLDPPGQCQPEVHPKCLFSTQKWARKNKKRPKKRVILFVKIPPLKNVLYAFSPIHFVGPSERFVLDPKSLIGESVFMEI